MKNLILIFACTFLSISSQAQLPDLIGEKASIKMLKSTYRDYYVESGKLLDVGSSDSMDDIYLDSEIRGTFLDMNFYLTSSRNGVIDNIQYYINSILPEHFESLKNAIIKIHSAQYNSSSSGETTYVSTLFGVTRYILFKRDTNGKASVKYILSRY